MSAPLHSPVTVSAFVHQFEPAATVPVANAPTALLLHSTGGDEHDQLPLGRRFGPGVNLLSLRGRVQRYDAHVDIAWHLGGHQLMPQELTAALGFFEQVNAASGWGLPAAD